jgi:hypothetical protein
MMNDEYGLLNLVLFTCVRVFIFTFLFPKNMGTVIHRQIFEPCFAQ